MKAIRISITGNPIAKGRPRFRTIKANGNEFTQTYTPGKTRAYETHVRVTATGVMQGHQLEPLVGPLGVTLAVFLPVAKSWPKKRRVACLEGRELPTPKPDLDNVAKAVLDGLAGIVFDDDSQICEMVLTKRYAEHPGVIVDVYSLVNAEV